VGKRIAVVSNLERGVTEGGSGEFMPRDGRQDHYEVLGLHSDAPDEVVRAAYRALAAKYHPDRNPSDRSAELKLKRLNAAFAVLGNPELRKQYDALTRSPEEDQPSPEDETSKTPSPSSTRSKVRAEQPPQQPRWKVPQEPKQDEPRWKVPGEDPQQAESSRVARAATRAASGSGRVLGWLAGAAVAAAVLAGLQGTCEKPNASASSSTTASTTTEVPTAAAAEPWVWITQQDYRIAFPEAPKPAVRTSIPTRSGTAVETMTELLRPSGAFYGVEETDYPPGAALTEQGGVDGALKGATARSGESLTLTSDSRATMGTCDGRNISASAKSFTVRFLFCIKGSRAYSAMVVLPLSPTAGPASEATSFLDSFSVTVTTKTSAAPTRHPAPGAAPSPTNIQGGALDLSPEAQAKSSACFHNELCNRCLLLGMGGDCYRYLNQPPQPKPKDCGCNGDVTCLMNCPTF
jgi:hypothetical protein